MKVFAIFRESLSAGAKWLASLINTRPKTAQRYICLLKMNISAQPLKMALHKNVGVKAGHMVIFLHEKVILLHGSKIRQFFSAR